MMIQHHCQLGYSAGAISGSVATMTDDGDASNVSISYAMGDITISESDTDRAGATTSSVTVSYAMSDGMTVSLLNSEDVNDVSVAYASGAISVGFSSADDADCLGSYNGL